MAHPSIPKSLQNLQNKKDFTTIELYARANGEAESFMKLMNHSEQISHLQEKNTIQDMLTRYRSTPHPATIVTPYEALMNRPVRTKLDHQVRNNSPKTKDNIINERDKLYKEKLKLNAENRNTKQHNFVVGDYVHVQLRQAKKNKWSTAYTVYMNQLSTSSSIAARRVTDGQEVYRDASRFNLANSVVRNADDTLINQDSIPLERIYYVKPLQKFPQTTSIHLQTSQHYNRCKTLLQHRRRHLR